MHVITKKKLILLHRQDVLDLMAISTNMVSGTDIQLGGSFEMRAETEIDPSVSDADRTAQEEALLKEVEAEKAQVIEAGGLMSLVQNVMKVVVLIISSVVVLGVKVIKDVLVSIYPSKMIYYVFLVVIN